MAKLTAASERLLMDMIEDGLDATPLEMLRRAYRAGQASAASEFARKGGSARSDAKTAAAKLNRQKGAHKAGRPKGAKDKQPRKKK